MLLTALESAREYRRGGTRSKKRDMSDHFTSSDVDLEISNEQHARDPHWGKMAESWSQRRPDPSAHAAAQTDILNRMICLAIDDSEMSIMTDNIKELVTEASLENMTVGQIVHCLSQVMGIEQAERLQPNLECRRSVGKGMCTGLEWSRAKKTVDGNDTIVVVMTTADFLRSCRVWEERRNKVPEEYAEMRTILRYGDIDGKDPSLDWMKGSLFLGLSMKASEMGVEESFVRLLLENSTSILYTNVILLAVTLMGSVQACDNKILFLRCQWDRKTGAAGPWTKPTIRQKMKHDSEWLTVEILWNGTKKNICIALLLRAILVGWMCLNLKWDNQYFGKKKTPKAGQRKMPKGCQVVVGRNGRLSWAVAHDKFRGELGRVLSKVTELQPGTDVGNLATLFEFLNLWLQHDIEDALCSFYYERLLTIRRLVEHGRCGILVALWYATVCEGEHGYDKKVKGVYESDGTSPLGFGRPRTLPGAPVAIVDLSSDASHEACHRRQQPTHCYVQQIDLLQDAVSADEGDRGNELIALLATLVASASPGEYTLVALDKVLEILFQP